MIEFDFKNIIVSISLVVNLLLMFIIFRYGKKNKSGRAYLRAIFAIIFWIIPMLLYRSHFLDLTEFWSRLLYVMASFTSTSFFYFTLVFPEDQKMSISNKILPYLLLENFLIAILPLHPTWLIEGVKLVNGGEDIILWGPLYIVFFLHITSFFIAGFYVLYKKIKKEKNEKIKKQIKSILVGYFAGANLAMFSNLLLPWFGIFHLNWMGQVCSTILAIFTTYAIFKFQLLDIKLIATEGFVMILNLVLFVQFIISDTTKIYVFNGLLFVAIIIISILLLKSVYSEVRRREEKTKLAQSLEVANLQLQEIDRQKTDFMSIAAHQLRTPLSILKGYIELIKDGAYGKPSKKLLVTLKDMDESNERLVKLVDEFLDITRLEQGRTKYVFEQKDMRETVSSVVRELNQRAEAKGLKIVWQEPKQSAGIEMDEEKVRHVVFNFVDNAIKYTEKGQINVFVEKTREDIVVRVKDNGFGFDKVDQASFFQKFYRGKNVIGTNVTGTGLGLFVCKKFIIAHDGKVWALSDGLGKGSEFGFSSPLKRRVEPAKEEKVKNSVIKEVAAT